MMRISFITGDFENSSDYLLDAAQIDQSILAAIDASLVVNGSDVFAAAAIGGSTLSGRSHGRRRRGRSSRR